MKQILSLLLFFGCLSYTFCATPSLVAVLARHGARAPLDLTFDEFKQWTGSKQELTSTGQRMSYILGSVYAKKYPSLLLPYNKNTVNIESTDYQRTIETAKHFVNGAYSASPTGKSYSTSLNMPQFIQSSVSQAIVTLSSPATRFVTNPTLPPIHTQDSIILAAGNLCNNFDVWKNQNKKNTARDTFFNTYMTGLVSYLRSKKIYVYELGGVVTFADFAIANANSDLPIPAGVDPSSQYYQDLKLAYEWDSTNTYTAQTVQTQITGSDFLQNVLGLMDKVVAGRSQTKFSMFSAHDVTLLPVLTSLGIVTRECLISNYNARKANKVLPYPNCVFPGYTANLAFELYTGSSPYVQVYYNGNLVSICNNTSQCTLKNFRADVEQKTNYQNNKANFKKLCGN